MTLIQRAAGRRAALPDADDDLLLYYGTCTVGMLQGPAHVRRLTASWAAALAEATRASIARAGSTRLLYTFRRGDLAALGHLGSAPASGTFLYTGPLPDAPPGAEWPDLPEPPPPAHREHAIHGFGKFVARVDYGGRDQPWEWTISAWNHPRLLSGTAATPAAAKVAVLQALPRAPSALRRTQLAMTEW
jgi:hypothetical protein